MHSFQNVLKTECAQTECAQNGMCPCGMQSKWNVYTTEWVKMKCSHLGMCSFWNVLFLDCAFFGMSS